jgi:hypothetical protein
VKSERQDPGGSKKNFEKKIIKMIGEKKKQKRKKT